MTSEFTFHEWRPPGSEAETPARIEDGAVHVWTSPLPEESAPLEPWVDQLSDDEQDRAARFRVEAPHRQFVFGRALLRRLLGRVLEVEPASINLGYAAHGKPFLLTPVHGRNLYFNLSHSGDHVAIVLAWGRQVGIDLERIDLRRDWMALSKMVFSPAELVCWHGLPTDQQGPDFFRAWTAKEAFVKATGEGLGGSVQDVEINAGEPLRLVAIPARHGGVADWGIQRVPLPAHMAGAVVVGRLK